MDRRVRTDQARIALREIIEEHANEAADGNDLISLTEREKLDPFTRRAEQAVRSEAGRGGRVHKEPVVERAMSNADTVWAAFNAVGPSYMSMTEVSAIKDADPELGALTEEAYLRVRRRSNPEPVADVKRYFDRFDFTDRAIRNLGERIDVRPDSPARANVPANVLKAYDYYFRAEAEDWATAYLNKMKIAGHDIYSVFMANDGDNQALELFLRDGTPLAGARLFNERLFAWDEFPERCRISEDMLRINDPPSVDGMSEPAERIAAGQVPLDWTGEVAIDTGTIDHRGGYLERLALPEISPEYRELAHAAFELLWTATLRDRVNGDAPLELGAEREGVLHLGPFTRPTDRRVYWIADWRDIDDASFTYYFVRTPAGLELALQQFNG